MFGIALLSIFLVAMIFMGMWGMRKTATLGDFFLGGRTIGPWFSAFAYGATYFSAVVFVGFAGEFGWRFGINAVWIGVGNGLIGGLLAWLVLGTRARRMSENLEALTIPGFLRARYGAAYLKLFAVLIIFFFLLPYTASVFKGLAHVFEARFQVSYDVALLIMFLITGIYLILGGYFAVALTDFVQGLIMIVGAVLLVITLTAQGGGVSGAISTALEKYPKHLQPGEEPGLMELLSVIAMTSFGPWGLPHLVHKFYAVSDTKAVRKATWIAMLFCLLIPCCAYFTGSLAHVFYDLPPMSGGKVMFDTFIPNMLNRYMPEGLMGIILLLILSASMSTLSSLILVSASAGAIDLYEEKVDPSLSQKRSLLFMRVLSGVFIVLSCLLAKYGLSVIVTMMSLSWGAVAGAFMAPFLYGLYWKRATPGGVLAGMVSALLVDIVLFFSLGQEMAPFAACVAMAAPFVVVPLVSLMTPPPPAEVVERAFAGTR